MFLPLSLSELKQLARSINSVCKQNRPNMININKDNVSAILHSLLNSPFLGLHNQSTCTYYSVVRASLNRKIDV